MYCRNSLFYKYIVHVHSVIVFAVLFGWVTEYNTDMGLFPVRRLRHPPHRVVCGEWMTLEDRVQLMLACLAECSGCERNIKRGG
jgi:hypothetical protein